MTGYQQRLFSEPDHLEDSDSWCTPPWLVALVRAVLGTIDLDPCSNTRSVVGATLAYTLNDDGLSQPWRGRCYVNPPYSDPCPWLARCESTHFEGGSVVALVKGDWSTRWWDRYCRRAPARCLLASRVKFVGSKHFSANFPSAVIYWGSELRRFGEVFAPHGEVLLA
jgi:hypothetical protein